MADDDYDFPVYVCPNRRCRPVVTIDPRMWEDPYKCPRCGADVVDDEPIGES